MGLNEDRMLTMQPAEKSTLFDVTCQACNHHQVTRNTPTSCARCQSLLISVTPAKGTVLTR
jgi:ribosomal protein S27E